MRSFITISIEVTKDAKVYEMLKDIKDQIYLMYPYTKGPIVSPIVISYKEE